MVHFTGLCGKRKKLLSSEHSCRPCFRTSRADPWGKSCSALWSLAVTHNTVSEVQSPSKVHMGNLKFYKVTVNRFKGLGLNFTRVFLGDHTCSALAQGRPTFWRSSMLSTMNWLPVRFCPLGGLWSESPVSSLSSSPANQDCPLLGQKNLSQTTLFRCGIKK